MKTPVFKGSSVAMVTPYLENGVDYDKLAELIDLQIEGGTAAVVINGTTGECSTQSIDEHIKVVDFAVKHAAGRIKVIAGSGSNDTNSAVIMGTAAEKSGADGLLCVTPYYNKATQKGLIAHFTHIADRVNIPIIVYHVPSRTGVTIAASTYIELARHPMINGVKEASKDVNLILQTRAVVGDDLYFWSGDDIFTVPCMAIGGVGVVSVLGNFLPRVMADICELCLNKHFDSATALTLKYARLMDAMFMEVNPMPVKTAMNMLGMNVGRFRLPMVEMEPQNVEKLRRILIESGLEPK